jgi:hypothetical protein
VDVRGTLRRTAKDLVYKDALYTVTYRLDDGTTRTYRFVPDLAAEGLWLAPFVQHPNGTIDAPRVTHLRFHCSTPGMVQAQLPILWEHTPLLPRSGITPPAYSLFGPQRTPATLLGRHSFDMGSPDPSWQFHSHQSTDSMAHSGAHANLLRPGSYSATYVQALDTFTAPVNVQASAWIRSAPDNTLAFAISVEDNTGILFWEAVDANDQLFDEREWWRVAVQRTVQPGAGRLLKVYIYNDGTRAALVDDMEVRLSHDTAPVTGGS